MSSHHFVREGQEPALLIMEGASFQSIAPLLEWSPRILVASGALEHAISWGIAIDAIVMDASPPSDTTARLLEEQSVQILHAETGILKAVVQFLEREKQHDLTVALDDLAKIRREAELFLSTTNITVITPSFRWIPIKGDFQKWSPVGSKYVIHPIDSDLVEKKNLRQEDGALITVTDGLIRLHTPKLMWVGEFL